jgi:Spy/CpxP family protein refolding chaperone
MRTFLFSFFAGAALATAPLQFVAADDDTMSGQTAPVAGTSQGQGERADKWRVAFEQLDLTDAQKAQIKQIRASVPKSKERRQQIMAVLTPDQKAKLRQMFQAHRGENQSGGDSATSTAPAAPATTTTTLPPP